jgi:calcium channel MID1
MSRGDQEVIWKRNQAIAQGGEVERGDVGISMGDGRVLKRQNGNDTAQLVYISVNTCLQPSSNESTAVIPQLTLYVSTSAQNTKPGPGVPDSQAYNLIEGYVEAKVNATGNVYIGVSAPNVTSSSGQWNYFIAASIDASYYYYNDTTPFIWTIDTDSSSALIATFNLTSENATNDTMALRQQWMQTAAPFSLFVYNQSTPVVEGIRNSYCGLQKLDSGGIQIEGNMTERGIGSNPKQQFYISGLQSGQKYTGVLAYNGVNKTSTSDSGAGVVGGGGQLWKAMDFTTKTGMSASASSIIV